MAQYRVQLSRKVIEYRVVTVNESSPHRAHTRALAMARGAVEPDTVMEAGLAEDPGEWCDRTIGRAHVRSVEEIKP